MEQDPVRYYEAAEPPIRAAVGGSDFLRAVSNIGQHRTIPALRLKHRFGGYGTASALPKCSIMSGCGTRIVLREQKPLALCDRCPCFGSLYPPLAALTFAAQSIICAFCLAAAAPRSPYRHLKLCGIASSLNFPTIAFLLNIDPIYKTGALWQQRAGFVVAGQGSGRYPQSACLTKPWG